MKGASIPAHDPHAAFPFQAARPLIGSIAGVTFDTVYREFASYRSLNSAKFAVLAEIETDLPVRLFTHEREIDKKKRRIPFVWIEILIPWCFIALNTAMVSATLIKP